jgi:hypothetical protein
MRMLKLLAASVALVTLSSAQTPPSSQCAMSLAFANPDDNGARTTAVWHDAGDHALLFGDAMHVNTDGTKRSYKVTDFWGKVDALNNPCNAMTDACAGLNNAQLTARRVVTQQAREAGWPAGLLARTRLNPQIIPFKSYPDGRHAPCPEVDGFLVSATALHDPRVRDECDLRRYVDALAVSAVVIPKRGGFIDRGAAVGDLAVVMLPGGAVFYAVVGDTGPVKELGEGSVALAGALLGKTAPPANYDEIRGRGRWAGRSWEVPKAFVLILPNSRRTPVPYPTQAEVEQAARPAFERWGGAPRLRACAAVYRR